MSEYGQHLLRSAFVPIAHIQLTTSSMLKKGLGPSTFKPLCEPELNNLGLPRYACEGRVYLHNQGIQTLAGTRHGRERFFEGHAVWGRSAPAKWPGGEPRLASAQRTSKPEQQRRFVLHFEVVHNLTGHRGTRPILHSIEHPQHSIGQRPGWSRAARNSGATGEK